MRIMLGLHPWIVVEHQEGEQGCRAPLMERGVLASDRTSTAQGPSPGKSSHKSDYKSQWGFWLSR